MDTTSPLKRASSHDGTRYYTAIAPELPDCLFQADTPAKAQRRPLTNVISHLLQLIIRQAEDADRCLMLARCATVAVQQTERHNRVLGLPKYLRRSFHRLHPALHGPADEHLHARGPRAPRSLTARPSPPVPSRPSGTTLRRPSNESPPLRAMWPTAHRGPRSPPADARGVPAVQGPRPGRGATAPKARARQGARIGGRRLAETCRLIADRRLDLHCTAVFRRVPESYIAFIEEFPVGTRRRSDWGEFQRRLYPHLAGRGNSRALPGRALVERLVEFLHLGTQLLLASYRKRNRPRIPTLCSRCTQRALTPRALEA